MVTKLRPWTFVLSEYLDLSYLLRQTGEPVVTARSAREAMEWLGRCCPSHIVIDTECIGADQVIAYARAYCKDARIEYHDAAISRVLAC